MLLSLISLEVLVEDASLLVVIVWKLVACQRLSKQLQHQLCRVLLCATSLQYHALSETARWEIPAWSAVTTGQVRSFSLTWILKGFWPFPTHLVLLEFQRNVQIPCMVSESGKTCQSLTTELTLVMMMHFCGTDISQSVLRSWSKFFGVLKTTSSSCNCTLEKCVPGLVVSN